ncbi:MAG TPA: hypothetical protein VMT17_11135 [Anaeromyxobacteraceae bacterium]|nr:hypothetical protein [Anaeromyxobacteraceae bacterium]
MTVGDGPLTGFTETAPPLMSGAAGVMARTRALPWFERFRVRVKAWPVLTTAGEAVTLAVSAARPTTVGLPVPLPRWAAGMAIPVLKS